MFSVWPELFAFELLAVALLRVTAGYFFLMLGLRLMRAARQATTQRTLLRTLGGAYGVAQVVVGGLLVIGLYTQPAAILGTVLTMLPSSTSGRSGACEQHMQLLLLTITLSLLFLGPGAFAFDMPI